jgi:transposase InsO family protein
MCRTKNVSEVTKDPQEPPEAAAESAQPTYYFGAVTCEDKEPPWTIDLTMCGSTVKFKIDCGADVSIMPDTRFKEMANKPKLQPNWSNLDSPGGPLDCIGQFLARTRVGHQAYNFRVLVVRNRTDCLLSRSVSEQMGLVKLVRGVTEMVKGIGCMKTNPVEIRLTEDVMAHVASIEAYRPASEKRLKELRDSTANDPTMQGVVMYTLTGWPQYAQDVSANLRDYYNERGFLSVSDGLLMYGERIVIPRSMRPVILDKMHEGHLGINKTLERAKMSAWWPGMTKDIKHVVTTCTHCQARQGSQRKEPLITTPLPEGTWHRVGADLCEHSGKKYLVMVDYYSRYIEILEAKSTTSTAIISLMKSAFAHWGYPYQLVTDNGPQFASSEFREYCEMKAISHITSSPHLPNSNGMAERAVQEAKKILSQPDPWEALMIYRDTVNKVTGHSPSQLQILRHIRTNLPVTPAALKPKMFDHELVKASDAKAKETYEYYYNMRHGARPLPPLQPGSQVLIKTDDQKQWSSPATVSSPAPTPRSYNLRTENGHEVRRNRRHIVPVPPAQPADSADSAPLPASPVRRQSPAQPLQPSPAAARPKRDIKLPTRFADYDMSKQTK